MEEERIRFVEHKGKKILLEDFSNVRTESELLALIKKAVELVHSQPLQSVRVCVDMTNAHYGPRVAQESKAQTDSNTPYIYASAMVGITSLMEVILRTIYVVTGRKLESFRTREEALDWLASR
jgi:hypothetical protein